jgi:tRNA pseudouridine55 synthase
VNTPADGSLRSPSAGDPGELTPSGLVVVDKPGGLTSHGVVARVRRLAGTRKVGHAGTLDPMATGVLVVGVGRATRLLGHLTLTEKAYDATVRLGVTTTTDDAEGEVVATAGTATLDEQQVRDAFAAFTGEIDQVPSAVSAIKVDGRRAYARVRAGEDVELAPRRVTVHELVVRAVRGDEVDLSLRCSSGTYVRAIARDAGAALGVGGHLTALRRTAVGPFTLGRARTMEQLTDDFEVVPIAEAARTSFPAHDLDEGQAADVRVGRKLAIALPEPGPVALFAPDGEFLALYEGAGPDLARAVAVFTG